jgi:arginine exporter protein ArgO
MGKSRIITSLILVFTGCTMTAQNHPVFTDIARQAGIGFVYTYGDTSYVNRTD